MPRRDERSVREDGGDRRAESAGSQPNAFLSPPVPGLLSEEDLLRVVEAEQSSADAPPARLCARTRPAFVASLCSDTTSA